MALSSFLNVNGYDFPPPRRGFSWTITTTVNGGRNENNAVIGQRVGRDLYKLSNLEWVGLTVVNVTASDGSYKNPVACTSMARTNGNLFICIPKATNSYLFIDAEWEIK